MTGIEGIKENSISRKHLIINKGITWIEGPGHFGKEIRFLVQEATAVLLSDHKAVHWIDGAHRFNPSTFFEPLRTRDCGLEEGLRRLYIGRGFTLHQLHALILRVHQETLLTDASLVVVDGLLAMFLDDQIRKYEGRAILRNCLQTLQKLSEHCAVIVVDGHATSKLHQGFKSTIKVHADKHLYGYWQTKKKKTLILKNTEDPETALHLLPKIEGESQSRLEAFTSTDQVVQHRLLSVDVLPTQME